MSQKKTFGLLLLIITILGTIVLVISLNQPVLQPDVNWILILTVASFVGAIAFLDTLNGAYDFIVKVVSIFSKKDKNSKSEALPVVHLPLPGMILKEPQTPSLVDPIQSTSINQSLLNRDALINALLGCQTMRETGMRNQVVDELPVEIRSTIERRNTTKADVAEIVDRCLEFPNGLLSLRERLQFYEGSSIPMIKVERLLE